MTTRAPEEFAVLDECEVSWEKLRSKTESDPDDVAASCAFNEFLLRHPDKAPEGRLKILAGPGPADDFWNEIFRPWATTVAFSFGDPRDSDLQCIRTRYDEPAAQVMSRLPEGFWPDVIVHTLPEFSSFPRWLNDSPVPVIGWVQDYILGLPKLIAMGDMIHGFASMDANGLETLSALGPTAFFGPGNGYQPALISGRVNAARPVDVAFLAGVDRAHRNPTYLERDRVVLKLSALYGEMAVLISGALDDAGAGPGPNYRAALRRSKILVCHTTTNRIHPGVAEGMAAGAMVMLNRGNKVADSHFEDGENIVLYSEDDLIAKIRFFVNHESERLRIAANGKDLISSIATHARLAGATIEAIRSNLPLLVPGGDRGVDDPMLLTGIVSVFDGDPEVGARDFERVIRADPENAVARNNLGVARYLSAHTEAVGSRQTAFDEAERAPRRGRRSRPEQAGTPVQRGRGGGSAGPERSAPRN